MCEGKIYQEKITFKKKEEFKSEQNKLKITTICGPMCAGKSAKLIELVARHEAACHNYVCFRPEDSKRKIRDDEDKATKINSRSKKLTVEAVPLKKDFDVKDVQEYIDNYKIFIFDEIHFLNLNSIKKFVGHCFRLHEEKEIIFAGLDKDFKGIDFEQIKYAKEVSGQIVLLTALCSVHGCIKRATHSAKISGDINKQIEASGEDMYRACCYEHWQRINEINGIEIQ